MTTILYIHGFLSGPDSHKAQVTRQWLAEERPDVHFLCPQLSSYPAQARKQLLQTIDEAPVSGISVIGSSMGGFWATHLVERGVVEKAVLINPAVMPQSRFAEVIGQPLKSYYSDEVFTLSEKDIDDLADSDVATIKRHQDYWLMVQTGDETLDYRLAVEKYQGCRQTVEEGGNHSFMGYDRWLPQIVDFLLL